MKPKLLLIGGGGHCRSCIEVVESSGQYEIAGIVGLPKEVGQSVLGYKILGSDEDLADLVTEGAHVLISVGQIRSAALRVKLYERVSALEVPLPAIIASSAIVSRHATIGEGTIAMHGAIINAGAAVGVNCIINSCALVEHDARVGDHCHVSTAAVLNGGVQLGERCFVGSGAVIHENLRIGAGSIVGAGAIVSRHVGESAVVRAPASGSGSTVKS